MGCHVPQCSTLSTVAQTHVTMYWNFVSGLTVVTLFSKILFYTKEEIQNRLFFLKIYAILAFHLLTFALFLFCLDLTMKDSECHPGGLFDMFLVMGKTKAELPAPLCSCKRTNSTQKARLISYTQYALLPHEKLAVHLRHLLNLECWHSHSKRVINISKCK